MTDPREITTGEADGTTSAYAKPGGSPGPSAGRMISGSAVAAVAALPLLGSRSTVSSSCRRHSRSAPVSLRGSAPDQRIDLDEPFQVAALLSLGQPHGLVPLAGRAPVA